MKKLLLGISLIALTTVAGIAAADDQMNQTQPAQETTQAMPTTTPATNDTVITPDANGKSAQTQEELDKKKKEEMTNKELANPDTSDAAKPAQEEKSDY